MVSVDLLSHPSAQPDRQMPLRSDDASPSPSSTRTFATNFSTPPRPVHLGRAVTDPPTDDWSAARRCSRSRPLSPAAGGPSPAKGQPGVQFPIAQRTGATAQILTARSLSQVAGDREIPTQSRCVGEDGRKPACPPQILPGQPDGKASVRRAFRCGTFWTDADRWGGLAAGSIKIACVWPCFESKRLAHPPTFALSKPCLQHVGRDSQQSPATRHGPRPLPRPPSNAESPVACPSPDLGASGEPLTLYYLMKMGPTIRLYDSWDDLVSALSRGASCHYDVYTNLMDACNAWLHVLQPHYAEAAAWAFAHQSEYLAAHGVDASVAGSPRSTSPPPPTPAATDASLDKSDGAEDRLATYFLRGQHVDISVSRTVHVQEELASNATGSASAETDGRASSPRSLSPPAFMAPPSPALLAGGLSSPSAESLGGFSLEAMIRRARVDSATRGNAWYGVVRGFTTGVLQGPYEYMVEDAVEGYNGTFYRGFQERRAAYNWYMEHRYD
ncbi:hypothetical protein FA95DRAFT_1602408 [Auriscalpium vulgare]|uniref:Uncharacterized protein n=1 Tax=Auriscalpium vulgare TaxID=40419 RepID=A0ACB8S774_9AGAM|nr:hypothetical protein FA95DRAFT_1602408 [Auriscalpium vulgare]